MSGLPFVPPCGADILQQPPPSRQRQSGCRLATVVGNPGSTEETFLKDFPDDFEYVQCLQEASAVAIADGPSQGLRRPVIVNLHTRPGVGNAMGCILTAYQNKTRFHGLI